MQFMDRQKYSSFSGNNLNRTTATNEKKNLIKVHNAADKVFYYPRIFGSPFLTCLCNLCVGYCSTQLQWDMDVVGRVIYGSV